MTWEIAPLRAAALRTERAVNQRWQTLRAAIIGSAMLLGVIGSAAAMSLTLDPSVPGGMGFLSAAASEPLSSATEHQLSADEARDGVADQAPPTQPADPAPPANDTTSPEDSEPAVAAPPVTQPEPERATPSAAPQPQPEPAPAPAAPAPTPSAAPAPAPEENDGLIGDLLDLLLPGLLP